MNFVFVFHRLKNSSPGELAYRLGEAFLRLHQKYNIKKGTWAPIRMPAHMELTALNLPVMVMEVSEQEVTEICSGRVYTLNTDIQLVQEFSERWGRTVWCDIRYDLDPVDIRAFLEPSRLQNLATLLLCFSDSSLESDARTKVLIFAKDEVLRWLDINPFPIGPNYISALECGIRIPVFFYAIKVIRYFSYEEYYAVLNAIYTHAWWISRRLSLYSSLGNHTVVESVGLVFAGALFSQVEEGRKWLHKGIALLRQELYHQILEDGGPAEQSFHYHRFVLDLYWLVVTFLEANGLDACEDLKPRLILGEKFMSSFGIVSREVLPIGDSDGGHAVAPHVRPARLNPDLGFEELQIFPVSGYSLIRAATNSCLVFDHGPLGMPPFYNHGHADALAIILYKDGEDIFTDPGTYRYFTDADFRRYFKSTRAHNTVTIDGVDQAVQETGFIWSHPYKTTLAKQSSTNDLVTVVAYHNGYLRLRGAVLHVRTVFLLHGRYFILRDCFSGKGDHIFELNFHVHPSASIRHVNGWYEIIKGGVKVNAKLLGGAPFDIFRGEQSPLLGWFSPEYGIKLPTSVLTCRKEGQPAEVSFLTVIDTGVDVADFDKVESTVWKVLEDDCLS